MKRPVPFSSLTRTTMAAAVFAWPVAVLLAAGGAPARQAPQPRGAEAARHHDTELFTLSDNCVACHNNLVGPTGENVSIGTTWRGTMMANAARDPYWQAGVRRETIDHPLHSEDIQDECAACHMPMAQKTTRAAGGKGAVFAHLPAGRKDASDLDRLAADGVSCTVCHQISSEGLGTRANFNGNFVLRPSRPDGVREIFGPFNVDAGRKTIMRSVTGFEQVPAPHVMESALCASCHTLITQAFGPDGEVIGSLPEQMNFQEWEHSAFYEEGRSCQSCHMPRTGPVRISSVAGDVIKEGLGRHVFVGGNAFMVRLLNRYRDELGVEALPEELEATAKATIRQLEEDTATLTVSPPILTGSTLAFDVDVRNLTGHKFPTGYPARRTWLHVTVRDAQGRTVFESGRADDTGRIQGNDNDTDALRFEPHYDRITSAEQVQIWEPILGDRNSRPTTGLLTATQYLKDNRLLPRGFDKTTADPEVGVYGGARNDPSFTGGGDRVQYEIAVSGEGPFVADVELCYQSIGYRWAYNLEAYDAPEPRRVVGYYREMAPAVTVVMIRRRTAAMIRR